MQGRRVFVSGGAGVIGSALVCRLAEAGATVLVGDLKPRPAHLPAGALYRRGDLNFVEARELQAFGPELFFHLAATFERSTESYEFWRENGWHNVRLSHHLMSCLKDCPSLRRVIFASSYLIYDPILYSFADVPAQPRRLRESDPVRPRNMTGAAKLLHEVELDFLSGFHRTRVAFDTVCARIFRVYGRHSRDVISRWVRALLADEVLAVYRPEGRFDYVFADDVAEGLLRLAWSSATGIVNLGRGRARSVAEVLAVLRRHFPAMRTRAEACDLAVEASEADTERFASLTGWRPATDIEEGIAALLSYERGQLQVGAATSVGSVLVTSASRKIPLLQAVRAAVQRLGQEGAVVAADMDGGCLARHFADDFWHMPRLSEIDVEGFIAECRKRRVGVVVPTRDGELLWMARARAALAAARIHVMVSPVEAVRVCLDKLAFHDWLVSVGGPAIPTASGLDDPRLTSVQRFAVKERHGSGSRTIGLDLDRSAARTHAGQLSEPIFQPFMPGNEYSVDVYVSADGRAKGTVARRREVVVGGESQVTTTERNQPIEALAIRLAERLGLRGHAIFQILADEAGGLHVVECNPRFGGASTLALAAGLDSFGWMLLEASGESLADHPFLRAEGELRQVRHPADMVVHAGARPAGE